VNHIYELEQGDVKGHENWAVRIPPERPIKKRPKNMYINQRKVMPVIPTDPQHFTQNTMKI